MGVRTERDHAQMLSHHKSPLMLAANSRVQLNCWPSVSKIQGIHCFLRLLPGFHQTAASPRAGRGLSWSQCGSALSPGPGIEEAPNIVLWMNEGCGGLVGFLLKTRMNVESSDLAPCGGQDSKDSRVSVEARSIPVVSWSQRLHKAPVPSGPFTGIQVE